jgi:hypothetical protein
MQIHLATYRERPLILAIGLALLLATDASAESFKPFSPILSSAGPLSQLETLQVRPPVKPSFAFESVNKPSTATPAAAYTVTKGTAPRFTTEKTRILQIRSTPLAVDSAIRTRLRSTSSLFVGPLEERRRPVSADNRILGPTIPLQHTSGLHAFEESRPLSAMAFPRPGAESESDRMDQTTQEILHGGN